MRAHFRAHRVDPRSAFERYAPRYRAVYPEHRDYDDRYSDRRYRRDSDRDRDDRCRSDRRDRYDRDDEWRCRATGATAAAAAGTGTIAAAATGEPGSSAAPRRRAL